MHHCESARTHLSPAGQIFITTVDTPYYDGAFRFEDAAQFSGCTIVGSYPFDPSIFRGYSHTNTCDDKSAIDDYKRFVTRVFKKEE